MALTFYGDMDFSNELREKFKKYFKDGFGIELTDAEANRYLEKLGALGSLAYDILATDSPVPDASVTAALTTGCKPVVISRFEGSGAGGTRQVSQYPQTPLKDDGK